MQFKGLGFPNKYFAKQNKQMYIRLHCLRKLCSVYGTVFRFVCRFRRTATNLNKNRMFLPRKVGRKEKDFVLYCVKNHCKGGNVMTPARKLYSLSRKAEFISIYCPVVQSRTYMIATVFWNKTA